MKTVDMDKKRSRGGRRGRPRKVTCPPKNIVTEHESFIALAKVLSQEWEAWLELPDAMPTDGMLDAMGDLCALAGADVGGTRNEIDRALKLTCPHCGEHSKHHELHGDCGLDEGRPPRYEEKRECGACGQDFWIHFLYVGSTVDS